MKAFVGCDEKFIAESTRVRARYVLVKKLTTTRFERQGPSGTEFAVATEMSDLGQVGPQVCHCHRSPGLTYHSIQPHTSIIAIEYQHSLRTRTHTLVYAGHPGSAVST